VTVIAADDDDLVQATIVFATALVGQGRRQLPPAE